MEVRAKHVGLAGAGALVALTVGGLSIYSFVSDRGAERAILKLKVEVLETRASDMTADIGALRERIVMLEQQAREREARHAGRIR